MQYIFVIYHYDADVIFSFPMKNRIDIEFVFILDIFYTFYKNEESHQTYTFLTAKHIQNNTTSQLVESYNKQVNATE